MHELINIDLECVRCGMCEEQQAAEGMPVIMCGDLAQELTQAADITEVSPEAYEFLVSCSICDACTANCPRVLSCAQLVKAGRKRLLELEPELAEDYRAYRVDYRESLFNAFKEAAGFEYEDALDMPPQGEDSVSLFFPGCSLSSYSQDLTQASYELLLEKNAVQGMSVYCCGKPLGYMGAGEELQSYGDSLIERLRQCKVSRLVVACPNCFHTMNALLVSRDVTDIELEPLPEVLLHLGFACTKHEFGSVSVHDACPDRYSLRFAKATRALLEPSGVDILEMESRGLDTICCGAGGLAGVGGPTLSAERRRRRLSQFADTEAECLVCNCMSCASAFLSGGKGPMTLHYLELLLDVRVDWYAMQLAFDKMYIEAEVKFTQPLSESTKVFDV